jgi:diguanylate cyclase (GGDEF)-like protein/PAS domain S-box-containing protein/putative nucleotidyltransferase with HDIG domain
MSNHEDINTTNNKSFQTYKIEESNAMPEKDIKARESIEEALKHELAFNCALLENIPDGVIACDSEGNLTLFNRTAREWHGMNATKLTKEQWADCYNLYNENGSAPLNVEEIPLSRALEGEIFQNVEMMIRAKNQPMRYISANGCPFYDDKGKKLGAVVILSDITESKQAEEVIQSNQNQLTDIIEFLPDATLAIDKERRVIIWNKAIEKMTSIPASEMIGKSDYVYTIPFYGEARPHLMDLVFLDDDEISTRYPNLTREGDTLMVEVFCPALYNNKGAWVFAKASPLHDQSGNIIGAIESIRDITEQKLAEEVLQSKTAFLEAQTNASLDGILVVNQNNTRILTNCRIFELFNVPQHIKDDDDDTLLLKHVVSLTKNPEQFLKKVNYLYDHLYETSYDEIEFKSGMVLDRYSSPIIGKEGIYYGRIWSFHDITDRKKLEVALANEKKLLETTLISVGDGVISTDNEGNIVFLNKVAEFLTGWNQEAARGKSIEEVFHIVNELTREKSENIVKIVLGSRQILEIANHAILISADGTERPIEDSAAPIVHEDGKIVGVVLIFRDVSEKKIKQEEILYLSYHDELTGLYNRRFYEEEIKRLDTERNLPISIIMGDVNGLKLINDAFGHLKGDELLQKAALAIRSACRADDIVARWGGDEFVILLPKTKTEEAVEIITRIKDQYSNESVNALSVSISFGWETKNNATDDILKVLKSAEDYMYKHKIIENEGTRGNTINTIINTLHEKNPREEQHSKRVSEICQNIGRALGLSEIKISKLKVVGLLHDIGKIAIEEGILNKPGKLTEQEWVEIKRHPDIGYRIFSSSYEMLKLADYILAHHERWDGSGYPKGLKGKAIPRVARIIALADSYDAMTSERPYRKALREEVVLAEIRNNAGTQFDPEIARIFIEKVLGKSW